MRRVLDAVVVLCWLTIGVYALPESMFWWHVVAGFAFFTAGVKAAIWVADHA